MRRSWHAPEPSSDKGRWLSSARRHPWLLALAVIAMALVVLVSVWDWNWFKGPIERQVQARTGREFDIGGDLDVDLHWRTPTIRAERVRFGNAAWSKQPTMAQAERVEFSIRLWPLLRGQVRIPELRLSQPVLHLEMGPGRTGNWKLGKDDAAQAGPGFSRLWIDDGKVTFLDPDTRTDFAVDVTSLKSHGRRLAGPDLAVAGHGRWKDAPFQLSGVAESPLHLRDRDRPYRIDMRASAGATRAHARGTLVDPVRLHDFDLKFALSGQDMADLYPLLGIATPPTPPYRLDGRLTREYTAQGTQVWRYTDFTGVAGDSDLAGDASIETGGERPFLRANVASRRLDFDDLAGFIGKAPQPEESTNPQLAARAASDRASSRLLPDRPYRLEKLRSMDADVRYRAHRINAPDWPLDHMETNLRLRNGLLTLEPLNFGVAGGKVRSVVGMDAREEPIRTRAHIAANGLDLRQMIPQVERAKDAVGKVGGTIALAGTGNSIAQMLGSSDGEVAVGMGRGQISNLLMELAGIDVAESLKFLVTGDRKVPIRCAFGAFSVSDGVMTARALAFDTTDTIIVGEGTINLREERLQLKLRPRPKDRSLFALRSPLRIEGNLKDPDISPDLGRIGLRGALALTLATITPPAALLATIEQGPGEDSGCGGRYAE